MTSTRRMIGPPEWLNESSLTGFHDVEHDWDPECDEHPPCRDVESAPDKGVEKSKPDGASYDPPPSHYDGGAMDVWAIWDAYDLDRYLANAVKYICRAGKKDIAPRLDDLKKAANYIAKAIEMEERRG